MLKNINKKIYDLGADQIERRYKNFPFERWTQVMEDLAWNAFYNDNYKIRTLAEGYFLIVEVYTEDTAYENLRDYTEQGITPNEELGAVA